MVTLLFRIESKTNHLSGLEEGKMSYGQILKNYLSYFDGINRYHG
jgi:hypothetical protein